ncbi:MAG: outer membrane protein transport protein [Candidatus Hydrogenedentes bacterium]|nr:outer membrane protein transport protein [Candidatus Hydrogenedentota bacterium]
MQNLTQYGRDGERKCRGHVWRCALALCAFAAGAAAQQVEISVSPTPVGSGARAAGMADAFVAIADDATAASWNPAGLVQLERPEISVVGAWNGIQDELDARDHPEFGGQHWGDNAGLNYLSAVYPLPFLVFGKNCVASINYQRKYDFTRRFSFDYTTPAVLSTGQVLNRMLQVEFEQTGGLGAISPAFAFELTQRLSLGITLNLWRSTLFAENGWENETDQQLFTLLGSSTRWGRTFLREEYHDFTGENVTLGALWTPGDHWSFGLRYDSAFTGDVDYEARGHTMSLRLPSVPQPRLIFTTTPMLRKENRKLRFPESIALGAAYRVNDKLTFSFDVTRTDWDDFYLEEGSGLRRSPVDFSIIDNPLTKPNIDPTYSLRCGVERVLIPKQLDEKLGHLWTLRGGLFFDQEPATHRSSGFHWLDDRGSGLPDDFVGAALGAGLQLNQRVNLDCAYQLRYGKGVNSDFIIGVRDFKEDVMQHRFLASIIVYF